MTRLQRAAAGSLLLAALWLVATVLHAQDVQPVPPLAGRVIDQTLTLDPPQRSALEAQLATIERERGAQIVVLMIGTTQPEDIAAYAQRVADSWKIGRRAVGDGLLFVIAKDDRRVRIEVAKTLEGAVPDLAARQIIEGTLRPALRDGDYAGGLGRAIAQIDARLRGEALPAPEPGRSHGGASLGFDLGDLGLFLFVGVPVAATLVTRLFGRKFGSLLTAGGAGGLAWWLSQSLLIAFGVGVVALIVVGLFGIGSAARRTLGGRHSSRSGDGWIIGSPGWGGGGGGWGGGGDSFSSGGGGDFGGGGASGDW